MNLPVHLGSLALALSFAAPLQAAPAGPPRVGVTLTFVEPGGKALGEKRLDAILGSETPAEFKDRNRTISVKTTVRMAAKADCYTAEIDVRDQDIDPGGRFSKKEWKTRGDVCVGFQITLGPRDETRVRVQVQPQK
jgi:hypothetical protein